jgi:universal stress protein A
VSVQHGDPAGVIVLQANAEPFDLVVLGTHQRLQRFRVGSVAECVAQRVACPVLVVPVLGRDSTQEMSIQFKNILCPMDFTPASQAALEQALSIAQRSGGRLTALHVLEGVSPESSRYASHFIVPEYRQLLTRDAWQRLQAVIPAGARGSCTVHARVVTGRPADEIVRIAWASNVDAIVMGVTSRGAIGRRVFGSTASRVMRSARCPVLVVRELKAQALPSIPEVDATTPVAALTQRFASDHRA